MRGGGQGELKVCTDGLGVAVIMDELSTKLDKVFDYSMVHLRSKLLAFKAVKHAKVLKWSIVG